VHRDEIIGYQVKVVIRKAGDIYTAKCPGIGGVYEEAKTKEEVLRLARESVEAIIEARIITRTLITEDNPYLKVLWRPTRSIEFMEIPKRPYLNLLIPDNAVSATT
jgi:predicted RNase H-like HicB family nuclease